MGSDDEREDQPKTFDEGRAELEHRSPEEKARAVTELIRKASATSAVTSMQPFPLVDVVILTPLQHRMVRAIAGVYGVQLDAASLRRVFRVIRGPIVAVQTLIALSKFAEVIPFVSEALSASLAYAFTHAIGEVSGQYFSRRSTRVDELESRVVTLSTQEFEEAFRVKRSELEAIFRDPDTRRQIRELKRERRQEKIDVDEEAQRMDAILRRAH